MFFLTSPELLLLLPALSRLLRPPSFPLFPSVSPAHCCPRSPNSTTPAHCTAGKARSSGSLRCPTSRLGPRTFWWLQMWLVVVLISKMCPWLSTMIWPKILKVSASEGGFTQGKERLLTPPSQSQGALKTVVVWDGAVPVSRVTLPGV